MDSTNSTLNSTLTPLTLNYSLPPPVNLSTTVYPDLHHPVPTIITTVCLFLVFAGCAVVMATCRCSGRSGGCAARESEYGGQDSSGEPQLKLWKRLGSGRYSFSSGPSFRRTPQRSALTKSKLSYQLEQDRNELQAQLTIPCLLQYATEI
ncbi:uncharacterized protein Hap1MRO34_009548 [Clarias gariepinus]|uniref:uncharacterized protein C10orf105-like n=1 Tax=Clarias gariepinus TaxID=13013 RepID=UPI00234C4A23|nr:uncharacterized protein C10orf105-like [Clarias gariepinus]